MLGQFAKTMLNAVRIADSQHGDIAKRIRTVVQAFEGLEDSIVQQMCQINCTDKNGNSTKMDIDRAIQVGMLNISTPENIAKIPNMYRDPTWTLWHQLKTFFAYYTRDMDAPMFVDDGILRFWLPPSELNRRRHPFRGTSLFNYEAHRISPMQSQIMKSIGIPLDFLKLPAAFSEASIKR